MDSCKYIICFTLILMIVSLLFPPYGIDFTLYAEPSVHKQFVKFDTLFKSNLDLEDGNNNSYLRYAIRWHLLAVIQLVIALAGAAFYSLLLHKKK